MSEQSSKEFPYHSLGMLLKRLREKKQRSLAEVSGAVEIDVTTLSDIEQGSKRPSQDILQLLISYFAAKEPVAHKLWELAGYDKTETPKTAGTFEETVQPVLVMPMDARIVYTDMFHVSANEQGVVMNFMQGAGPNNQPLAVSRVGMSKEHALSVLELLLDASRAGKADKPKLLPAPEQKQDQEPTA